MSFAAPSAARGARLQGRRGARAVAAASPSRRTSAGGAPVPDGQRAAIEHGHGRAGGAVAARCRPGRRRRRSPRCWRSRGPKEPTACCGGCGGCVARGFAAARAGFWSRRQSAPRTCGSTCRRSVHARSWKRPAAGLPASPSAPLSTLVLDREATMQTRRAPRPASSISVDLPWMRSRRDGSAADLDRHRRGIGRSARRQADAGAQASSSGRTPVAFSGVGGHAMKRARGWTASFRSRTSP